MMRTILMAFALLLGIGLVGCVSETSTSQPKKDEPNKKDKEGDSTKKAPHSGWWCDEHGLPEKECWACSPNYAKACKEANDWCDKHERPQSQCFKCDPKLISKWAKMYETKYGKKPPEFEDY